MFVGHLAVALGAKTVEPKAPLGALVAASFGVDLLWPLLLFAKVEIVQVAPGITAFTPLDFVFYPYTHSLAAAVFWGLVGFGIAYLFLKSFRVAAIIGSVVVSHWVLDFVTHRPDLPLGPADPKVGLGLWNSIPGTLIVEGGLFAVAIALYVRSQKPTDAIGRWAFFALIALTGLIWVTQPWSPPPPSATAVAVVALAMWLFPVWAWWIDRHRTAAT
ncbi:MAG: hypothetical protein R3344_03685 [Acidobacteriota bacterium]|nr:hypothetical protein [Acidobacteriota bacterium]